MASSHMLASKYGIQVDVSPPLALLSCSDKSGPRLPTLGRMAFQLEEMILSFFFKKKK